MKFILFNNTLNMNGPHDETFVCDYTKVNRSFVLFMSWIYPTK